MDQKPAAKHLNALIEKAGPVQRDYRTHSNKLAPFWCEIEALLKQDAKLKPYIIFDEMRSRHPDTFLQEWKRTLERRITQWTIDHRIEQKVSFEQDHLPGDVLAIDFPDMNELKIIVAGKAIEHKVFHA